MSNKVILKRSSVAGKVPTTGSLDYGELALNYTDGKLYYKDVDNIIRSIGGGGGLQSIFRQTYVATAGESTFAINYTPPNVDVFVNGIHLKPNDYTATSGSTVNLAVACSAGDVVDLIGYVNVSIVDLQAEGLGLSYDDANTKFTLASSSSNDANTVVYRDANGGFYAGHVRATQLTINSNYSLPTTDGTANQFLKTDGSGNVTFATVSSSNVTEGTNLYYTDARVQAKLGSVSGHIVPDTNVAYDLGSSTYRFRDLYLSGSTINLGGTTFSRNASGDIEVKDPGTNALKNIKVKQLELDDDQADADNRTVIKKVNGVIKMMKVNRLTGAETSAEQVDLSSNTTSDLSEGTNLYFTASRARGSLSASDGITYNSTTGAFTLTDTGVTAGSYGSASAVPVLTVNANGQITSISTTAVAGVSGFSYTAGTNTFTITTSAGTTFAASGNLSSFNTGNLTEGSNLYYTDTRARAAISVSGGLLTYGSGVVGLTSEAIQDVVGAMVASNTESGISVTYNDVGNVLDFAVDTATIATRAYVDSSIQAVIDAAPAALDTLNELAAAINDDANYAATVTTALSNKADKTTTVTAGTGLTGGGTLGSSFTISHADTSNQVSVDNTGNTFIQDITLDGFGHITGISSATVVVGDGAMTVTAGTGLAGGGQLGTANQSTASSVTLSLAASGVTAGTYGSSTAIPVLVVDTYGRVTSASNTSITVGDGTLTVAGGSGLTGSGTFTANSTTNNTITLSHADTSSAVNLTASGRTYVTGLTFDTYGHVTGYTTGAETVVNTTYSQSAVTTAGGALLRLSGSDSTNDDIMFASGTNVTVAYTDANTITISANDTSVDWSEIQNKPDPVITLAGDLTGSVTLTDLASGTLTATIAANSVALGADTTGNYMVNVLAGTGITVSHTQGEGSTATVSVDSTIATKAYADAAATAVQTALLGGAGAAYDTLQEIKSLMDTADASLQTAINNLTIGNGIQTITAGAGMTGGGSFSANQTTNTSVTISHADTSAVANVTAATNTFISGITFDTYGHVQTISTASPSGFLTTSGKAADSELLDGVDSSGFCRYYEQSTNPGAVNNGSIWVNTATSKTYQRQVGVWVQIAPGNSGVPIFNESGTRVN